MNSKEMTDLTHFNKEGRARMIDVSEKKITKRIAQAKTEIQMRRDVYERIQAGTMAKGDVLAVAQVAGIMAAKNTPQIIPMCHALALSGVDISFAGRSDEQQSILTIEAIVKTTGQTGVEMEALTAVSAAALTVYDMCKAMDKAMVIGPTQLVSKSGGKSGDFRA